MFSCGPGLSEKVSRRAILDRSLDYESVNRLQDEDDIWFSSRKLFEDLIDEIHGKWDSIEDDIWGKVIVMERNRRVAKAYIRSPVISIGGGLEGFDGLTVGLRGFDNPYRDKETQILMSQLSEQCCKLQMNSEGFVKVLRTGDSQVSLKSALDALHLADSGQQHFLERRKPSVFFDMEKLKQETLENFMYYGSGTKNRKHLELKVRQSFHFLQ